MTEKTHKQKLADFTSATITVTPRAINKIKNAMKVDGKDGWMLRMGVEGGGCSGMNYKMTFDETPGEMDKVMESNGLKILCDLKSWLYLKGLEVDFSDDLLNGGFKIHNPNANRTCGCGTSFSV
ncbi:MAG TPA: iron-sulfur cluster assembly accessory protein [Candidatus Marinimicrobia bacterium]|jgi:iron-sulfur cluster assembly protein|nr:iron-sulfur cluster assembly accessory protein [Candidatus Neomarinimicrobiota bacterium]MDP7216663.1 iron-sulfur cluster assembly accessory protein [Candidatus Neomarinimicrobiota bacterium]MDP7437654.1 iron-sulfur cluster assembly accessory protein [Candidatus Neomarinimicrobiota bacterium]HBN45427.1 iron-sulfur cluster assembly accessory protein [Candidatus Neomarinimicrobiota bacterium]HJM70034.1 iron-sulfur cluster assembly accessory protein [Candidatus Neomarinimicrobiota bacterium]|tara:strand:+ start:8281 stop:8652 length:372 start_codon:yes stop_codon:yes gene_type:complete